MVLPVSVVVFVAASAAESFGKCLQNDISDYCSAYKQCSSHLLPGDFEDFLFVLLIFSTSPLT